MTVESASEHDNFTPLSYIQLYFDPEQSYHKMHGAIIIGLGYDVRATNSLFAVGICLPVMKVWLCSRSRTTGSSTMV